MCILYVLALNLKGAFVKSHWSILNFVVINLCITFINFRNRLILFNLSLSAKYLNLLHFFYVPSYLLVCKLLTLIPFFKCEFTNALFNFFKSSICMDVGVNPHNPIVWKSMTGYLSKLSSRPQFNRHLLPTFTDFHISLIIHLLIIFRHPKVTSDISAQSFVFCWHCRDVHKM